MNILVLGSSGYIGRYLTRHLVKSGYCVFGFDIKDGSSLEPSNFRKGDVRVKAELKLALNDFNPDVIIDLAALAEVGPQFKLTDYSSNYCTPKLIAEICNETQTNVKNIIFTSTQYVIGPDFSGAVLNGYAPHTVYGQSKVLLEMEVFGSFADFNRLNIDVSIVRPTNVWGGSHPKYSTVWEKLLRNGLVAIPRKEVHKSYCHITSLVELYESLLMKKIYEGKFSDLITYGTDELCSQSQWVDLQVKALTSVGLRANYWRVPSWILKVLSIVMMILGKRNPLPPSRVESMLIDYQVSLDRHSGLSKPKSIAQLVDVVKNDIRSRYFKNDEC